MKHFYYRGTVDVEVDVDEALDSISFEKISEAYEERLSLDENEFNRCENRRSKYSFTVSIDPEDYGLVDSDDIECSQFETEELINEIQSRGYLVETKDFENCLFPQIWNLKYALPTVKRNRICDILELPHTATNDQIIEEFKKVFF